MGLARSTFYNAAAAALGGGETLTRISTICDEFECYGYGGPRAATPCRSA